MYSCYVSNFGFSIPSDAIITKMTVAMEAYLSNNNSAQLYALAFYIGSTRGNQGGWYDNVPNTPTVSSTASTTNLPTAAELNSSSFRVGLAGQRFASACTLYVDYVRVTVEYYRPPPVTTTAITGITVDSAAGGGTVTADGGSTVTDCGICWNTTGAPTVSDSHVHHASPAVEAFAENLTGLVLATTYHVRAFAVNAYGTSYGGEVDFATTGTITTTTPTSITSGGASSGGNISTGTITARGVCWSLSAGPTIADGHTTDGSGSGSFTSAITGIYPSFTYHVRAYATTANGTAYGDDLWFTTLASSGRSLVARPFTTRAAAAEFVARQGDAIEIGRAHV
jgi:hypothetical protein